MATSTNSNENMHAFILAMCDRKPARAVAKCTRMLQRREIDLHTWGDALFHAVGSASRVVCEFLLANGCEVNYTREGDDATALEWACRGGLADNVALLLSRGARVNTEDGQSLALAAAMIHDDLSIVHMMLAAGAAVDIADTQLPPEYPQSDDLDMREDELRRQRRAARSPITAAVSIGNCPALLALLQAGAHPDTLGLWGKSPLMLAVRRVFATPAWESKRIQRVHDFGADTNCLMVDACDLERVSVAIATGSVSTPNLWGRLSSIATAGCAIALISAGADVNARDTRGFSALHCAAEGINPLGIGIMLASGCRRDVLTSAGRSWMEVLADACMHNDNAPPMAVLSATVRTVVALLSATALHRRLPAALARRRHGVGV